MPYVERIFFIRKLFLIVYFLQSKKITSLVCQCKMMSMIFRSRSSDLTVDKRIAGILCSRAKAFIGAQIILQEHKIESLKICFIRNGIKL